MREANTESTIMDVDIVIIGGGIAGLWTLARLSTLGYDVLLLEADSLGCEQTGASQGIIHGGTKYALTGKLTHSSQSIRQMPARWKACLQGQGEIDLSEVKILSDHQYLWSTRGIASRLSGFFASKVMQSRMQKLDKEQHTAPFDDARFKGELYQLDEPVLDSLSVLESIRKQYAGQILHFPVAAITAQADDGYLLQNQQQHAVKAGVLILTAGAGNEKLLLQLGSAGPKMQRRPLQMPMLRDSRSRLPLIYAHCLGASALPKMTITSYLLADEVVWYLGGALAEKGVGRSPSRQIEAVKRELHSLMPWLDFSHTLWSTLNIDRAEPKMPDGSRPDEPWVSLTDQVITAWPVKLAMTPLMVDAILAKVEKLDVRTRHKHEQPIHKECSVPLKQAETSPFPWEKIQQWEI